MEPINYLQNVADPFAQALSGLKFGQAVAAQQQEQELIKQKQLQQQQYQQALARLQLPTATAADYENVMLISGKDQAEILKNVLSSRTTRQNQADIGRIAPIAFAIKTGNTNEAISLMNEARDAAANSGDAQDAQYFSKMIELAKTQPENVGNLFATKMTLIPGGKDALDNLLKLTAERRTEAAAIPALDSATAAARTAVAQADVAEGTKQAKIDEAIAIAQKAQIEIKTLSDQRDAELRTAQSNADIAKINAKYAEQIAKADLKAKNAQAFASGASAKASLAAADKSKFEMTQGPSPLITTIQDPKNPTETITVDVRRYTPGTSIGSAGVIGSSGKSAVYAQKEAKAEEGKTLVADIIDSLKANYQTLNTARAIPSSQRGVISNLLTAVEVSGPGQFASRITGSDVQPVRDVIQSSRLQLLNAIKQATGLSSQQLNSNVELQTWLKSVSDPTQQIEAVIPILENIEKFVGGGGKKIDSSTVKPEGGVDMNNPLLKK